MGLTDIDNASVDAFLRRLTDELNNPSDGSEPFAEFVFASPSDSDGSRIEGNILENNLSKNYVVYYYIGSRTYRVILYVDFLHERVMTTGHKQRIYIDTAQGSNAFQVIRDVTAEFDGYLNDLVGYFTTIGYGYQNG